MVDSASVSPPVIDRFTNMCFSSLHFAAGFFGVQSYTSDYHQLIEIEASGFNSTLAPYEVCPNANNNISSFGNVQSSKWIAQYLAPAQARLSPFIQGFNLTVTDVYNMQTLCPYEVRAFIGRITLNKF
jgi:hypothetical protein